MRKLKKLYRAFLVGIFWALVLGRGDTPNTDAQVNIPVWSGCIIHVDTGSHHCDDWAMMAHAGQRVYGNWHGTRWLSPNLRVDVQSYPIFRAPVPKPAVTRAVVSSQPYQESMLVTYYTDVGPMADGVETYWGAAACGYDLPLGSRVDVPGVGMLTCHDRIGYQPYRHVDVWGARPGLGSDWRTITVYP